MTDPRLRERRLEPLERLARARDAEVAGLDHLLDPARELLARVPRAVEPDRLGVEVDVRERVHRSVLARVAPLLAERRADEPLVAREPRLHAGHPPRVPRPLVIEAEQVEEPVREVAVQLLGDRPPLAAGAAGGGVDGDYHVAQKRPNPGRIR